MAVDFFRPTTLREALEIKRDRPDARPIAGGTDLMVEINFDRHRPSAVVDLGGIHELQTWTSQNGAIRLGSGMTFKRLISEVGNALPGLAIASRTVGSPQIRNRATIGGNLGTASPAGDALPPLLASDADIELASVRGRRSVALANFLVGPKQNALEPDELITAVTVARASGPQQFSKIGTRNAMVIAVASIALDLDPANGRVGVAVGSAGPITFRARAAEGFLTETLAQPGSWTSAAPLDETVIARFAELVAEAASPINDVRGTAAYRRHAVAVMARRTLTWAWDDHRRSNA